MSSCPARKQNKGKKRKHQQAEAAVKLLDGLVNLGSNNNGSIEDCLDELEQPPPSSIASAATTTTTASNISSHGNNKIAHGDSNRLDPAPDSSGSGLSPLTAPCQSAVLASSAPVSLLQESLVVGERSNKWFHSLHNRIREWNASFQLWQESGRYTPGLLPSFDLELSRHFKVLELSTYLLDACPNLRMPSFERWLIDCKLEEEEEIKIKMERVNTQQYNKEEKKKKKKQLRKSRHRPGGDDEEDDNNTPPTVATGSDPILASCPSILPASDRLVHEIVHASRQTSCNDSSKVISLNDDDTDDARRIVKELCRRTSTAVQELVQKRRQSHQQSPLQKGDRIVLEEPTKEDSEEGNSSSTVVVVDLVYHRKRWKQPFRIRLNECHYKRLEQLFLHTHGLSSLDTADKGPPKSTGGGKRATRHILHLIVMTLTLRYSSLSGGQLLNDLRGGGMQGAIHEHVFAVIQQAFSSPQRLLPILEGFASPFNHVCVNYASAFVEDVDFHFGAAHNFWNLNLDSLPRDFVCELNPPFAPALMNKLANFLTNDLLPVGESNMQAISFLVIVPTVNNKQSNSSQLADEDTLPPAKRFAQSSFQRLVSSAFCSLHIVLEERKHGYIEGAQHLRPTRYKESQYDTSVILLQTSMARKSFNPNSLSIFEANVRRASASLHDEELASRRSARAGEMDEGGEPG